LHSFRGSELVSSDKHSDLTCKFCQKWCFFTCSISSSDHNQMPVTKHWQATITNCTGTNTSLSILLFAGES
jgi:hypothetical protein